MLHTITLPSYRNYPQILMFSLQLSVTMPISVTQMRVYPVEFAEVIGEAAGSGRCQEYIPPLMYAESTSDEVEKQCPRGLVDFRDEPGQPTEETRDQAVLD